MDEVEVECKTPGIYPNLDDIIVDDDGPTLLLPCIVCNKTFKPEVLQRHSKVCEKNTNKKRKTFDSFKQRVKGTDLAEFLPFSSLQKRVSVSEKTPSPVKTSSRWKETHEAFVSAIRAARGEGPDEKGGSCSSFRPPDHEQCPYCERHFGKKAFDRHQEWCREQHSRQPPVIASSQAKERLEARIKYRAPPIKSKRAITREKYSPLVQRKVRQVSPCSNSNFSSNSTTGSASSSAGSTRHTSQSQQEQSNRLSKSGSSLSGRSQLKDSTSALGFNRGMAGRTSLRASQRAMQRPNSPTKRSSGSKLSASPTQRLSLDDSKLGSHYDKEDVPITSTASKKLLSKSQPAKQPETKFCDVQSAKPQRKHPSTLLAPATNLQSLQIEINPKNLKENNNNSKSSKNDQLWRQNCNAKHSPCHSPLLNPHSPAPSLSIAPRSTSKDKEPNKQRICNSKTNPVEFNVVAEMTVTKIGTLSNVGCVRAKFPKPSKICSPRKLVGNCNEISNPNNSLIDGMFLKDLISPDGNCSSTRSLRLSSSSEITVSSSCSADSNRTYITQSSLCCKADTLPDAWCDASGKTSVTSFVMNHDISPECDDEHNCKNLGLKRGFCDVLSQESSDVSQRGKFIPCNKKVKFPTRFGELVKKTAPFSCTEMVDMAFSADLVSSSILSTEIQIPFKEPPSCPCSGDIIISCEEAQLLNKQIVPVSEEKYPKSSCITWNDVAKNGNKNSQHFIFNAQSGCKQLFKGDELHWQEAYCQDELERLSCLKKTEKMSCLLPSPLIKKCLPQHLKLDDRELQKGHKSCSNLAVQVSNYPCCVARTCLKQEGKPSCKFEQLLPNAKEKFPQFPKFFLPKLLASKQSITGTFRCDASGASSILNSESALNIRRNLPSIRLQPLSTQLITRTLLGGHILPSMYNLRLIVGGERIGSCKGEPYDPYASAERQMLELLRSDSACGINKNQKQRSPSPAPSLSPMPSPTLPLKPSPLETSPTSAFTRYAKDSEFLSQSQMISNTVESQKSDIVGTDNNCVEEEMVLSVTDQHADPVKLQGDSEVHLQSKPSEHASKVSSKPLPPPRSNKRLASIQHPKNLDDIIVSGVSASRSQLQAPLDSCHNDVDPSNIDFSNRPKTYDVESHSKKKKEDLSEWFNVTKPSSSGGDVDSPTILEGADGGKVEVLNLENKTDTKIRCETRESREIREITEQETGISDIDNLLEEVVRMQRSVSMLSEVDSSNIKDALPLQTNQSSARSRRNRAGKMHIEDFLFPAELLERENNNIRAPSDTSDCAGSVFGSTKSRRSLSKGCRLIEDMLFPPGADFNANSDLHNEDNDVVVSANALSVTYPSPGGFNPKTDLLVTSYPMSPVALTSKAPSNNSCDGLPRPKPMSLSTHSSIRNGCYEGVEKEPGHVPLSPLQAPNQSRQSTSSRLSADSAYSSLNRRSPVPQARRQYSIGVQDVHHRPGDESPQSVLSQSLTQSLVLSSSGSESSLPPLSASQSLKRGSRSKHDCETPSSDIVSATTPSLPKLSKFCHQCGTKFLISVAKFCHECGAARLEIC